MASLFLVVTRGGETQRFPIQKGRALTVGRGQDAEILVADVSISRHQFTVRHAGDALDVEISPQSRNQVFLNGRPMALPGGKIRPGDRLSVGYCSFELQAESELPQARPAAIPPDPAGHIDAEAVAEEQRIAPRWRAAEEAEAEARRRQEEAARRAQGQKRSLAERLALPGMLAVLCGLLGVYYVRMIKEPEPIEAPQHLDLFADPPPIDCADPEECYGRAKRAYDLGVKLSEQSGADPATLYKAARQFQIATLALRGQGYRLPELQPRWDAARKKVITAFEDARLRLWRAQQEGNPSAALSAVEEQLAFLQESKHPYRNTLLKARIKIREVRDQARREAISSGKVVR
jgi:hypothetical protein